MKLKEIKLTLWKIIAYFDNQWEKELIINTDVKSLKDAREEIKKLLRVISQKITLLETQRRAREQYYKNK